MTKYTNMQNSTNFSDDAVRRFLLGRLGSAELSIFEARLIADDDLEARVRLAEFDLADDYVFSRLSLDERQRFKERFLLGADRKLKLSVSSALRDRLVFNQPSVKSTTRFLGRFWLLSPFNGPVARIAFAVVTLLVVVGSALLLIKKGPRITNGIGRIVKIRRLQPQSTPGEAQHAPDNSAPEHRETPSTMPGHDRIAPSRTIQSIKLSPAVSLESGEAPSINLTNGEQDILRLELAVKPDPSGLYQAQLSTINGQDVLTAESLRPIDVDARKIELDLPASLLKAGDYRVKLSRIHDGSAQALANYYFRVK